MTLLLLIAACTHPEEPADTGGAAATTEVITSTVTTPPEPIYDHLPVFRIRFDGSIPDGSQADGTLEVIRDHDGTLDDLDAATLDAAWPIGIERHGSSSAGYPKLNLRVECRESDGSDTACPLLDLPGASDWVLHGPYCDKALIRNAFAYTIGRDIAQGTDVWQPRTAFLELILNEEYEGVYLLVERVQPDDDRLDVGEPAPTAADGDLSGGYILKIDQNRSAGWVTARGTPVDYHEPKADQITAEQDAWLKGWWEELERQLDEGFADPATGYPNWFPVDAWVDFVLQQELSANIDAYRLSTYLYKYPDATDPRLHVGPLWDFDRAYGDVNYCDSWRTDGWIMEHLTTCGYGTQYPFWWLRLMDDPAFQDALRCRWDTLRLGVLSDTQLSNRVDMLVAQLDEAQPRDQARWGTIGVYVDPNYYVGKTYVDEVEWFRAWVLARAAWMDTGLEGTCG